MPDLSKYDLDFRPKNYWDLRGILTFVEAKITGKERKEIIKKEIQEGRTVPEELLKGSLDKNLRKLYAARDRIGEKPFYYNWDGKTFTFASSPSPIFILNKDAMHTKTADIQKKMIVLQL